MDPIRTYLADDKLPSDYKEADRIKRRVNWFILYDGILYKRSFTRSLLRCLTPEVGKKILEELHEGVCSSHVGGCTIAVTTICTGYYWPSFYKDAMNLVYACDKCQKFASVQRLPTTPLTPIISPLPFVT